jgi:hypothetical protein
MNPDPFGWASIGTTVTALPTPTVDELLALVRSLPKPPRRQVIVTPSLEALEAAIGKPIGRLEADGSIPLFGGMRVVIDKTAPRPMLLPAECFERPPLRLDGGR